MQALGGFLLLPRQVTGRMAAGTRSTGTTRRSRRRNDVGAARLIDPRCRDPLPRRGHDPMIAFAGSSHPRWQATPLSREEHSGMEMSGLVSGAHASARYRQSSQARRARTPSPRAGAGGSGEGVPSASMSASSGLSRPQARSAARIPAMVPFVTPIPFWQQAACNPPWTRPNPGAELRVSATNPVQVWASSTPPSRSSGRFRAGGRCGMRSCRNRARGMDGEEDECMLGLVDKLGSGRKPNRVLGTQLEHPVRLRAAGLGRPPIRRG